MKVYQRLAAAFVAEGATHVFGLMGDGNMCWIDELDTLGVKMLEVRHEGVGLGMADGWARATHTPGICTTTCGPGVTQLATALVTASRAASSIVAFVGEFPTNDDAYHQRLDQESFAAGCETGFVRLTSPDATDDVVRKAFFLARTESRPIMLSCPIDIQEMDFENDEPYVPSTAFMQQRPLVPHPDGIAQAAEIIAASHKPVIILGRGALWSGAGDVALKLGKRIGALIATTLREKNWLADAEFHVGISGNYATRSAMALFQEADCVIAVGASMNQHTTMAGLLYPNARIVHMDAKAGIIMGGGRPADCYVQTDARLGLEALEGALAKRSVQATGFRTAETKKRLLNHYADPAEFPIEEGHLDPREVCMALDEIVPSDIALITGSGTAASGFSTVLCNRPRPYVLNAQFFGCIGQMFPAAMGAVVAKGNQPAFLIDGDASFLMHLADFDTAVRYEMPLLVVVLNDQALGAEFHKLNAHKMKAELSTIRTPDLGAVGVALGGKGRLVRTIEDLRAAVAEWIAKPCPMIIDARISRNVMSLSYRRVLYAKDE